MRAPVLRPFRIISEHRRAYLVLSAVAYGLTVVGFLIGLAFPDLTLVPLTADGWVALIPHSLTLVIELQAYILLLLGVYLHGVFWVRPALAGVVRHRQGYLQGLRRIGGLTPPALALLVIGAVWEAYSLRYLVHPLGQWLA